MASTTPFFDAVSQRRSEYALTNKSQISQSRIEEIVYEALKYSPSAFNVRGSRCIILYDAEHRALWENAEEEVPKVIAPALRDLFVPRIGMLKPAYGTILFFEDTTAKDLLPPPFIPSFTEYPEVVEHAAGMIQYIVWTALAAEGLGCNLQHYQPGITPYINKKYNVPDTWEIKAQLVFGQPTAGPGPDKERTHIEVALRTYGGEESASK